MKKIYLIPSKVFLFFFLGIQYANAQTPTTGTINLAPPSGAVPTATADQIVQFVFNLLIIIALLIAVIFAIYGGIKWITSGGDKAAVESARNTVVGALIGLIIVVLTWVIINFVLGLLGLPGLNTINLPSINAPTPTP